MKPWRDNHRIIDTSIGYFSLPYRQARRWEGSRYKLGANGSAMIANEIIRKLVKSEV